MCIWPQGSPFICRADYSGDPKKAQLPLKKGDTGQIVSVVFPKDGNNKSRQYKAGIVPWFQVHIKGQQGLAPF
jgi:hypothetical protein